MKTILATLAIISGFFLYSASAAELKDPVVTLTADEGTPFGSIMKILDALKASGVKNALAPTRPPAESKYPSVVLTVDENTSVESVAKIFDACKAAGVSSIALKITFSKETTK